MRGNKTYKNSNNLNHANELRIMPDFMIALMIMIMIMIIMMAMMMMMIGRTVMISETGTC